MHSILKDGFLNMTYFFLVLPGNLRLSDFPSSPLCPPSADSQNVTFSKLEITLYIYPDSNGHSDCCDVQLFNYSMSATSVSMG